MNKNNQDLEMREQDNHFATPTCSIEQAVMYLLEFQEKDIRPVWVPSSDSSGGEWLDSRGFDLITESFLTAESELKDAINNKSPEETIKEKMMKLKY